MAEKIKILLFGMLAQKAGCSEIFFKKVPDTDTLLREFTKEYPDMAALKFSVAINKKISPENKSLEAGDEIALLPPFSGG